MAQLDELVSSFAETALWLPTLISDREVIAESSGY